MATEHASGADARIWGRAPRWIRDAMLRDDRRDAEQFAERARGDSVRNLVADGWPEWSQFRSACSANGASK